MIGDLSDETLMILNADHGPGVLNAQKPTLCVFFALSATQLAALLLAGAVGRSNAIYEQRSKAQRACTACLILLRSRALQSSHEYA
jgi:hypothetical protein